MISILTGILGSAFSGGATGLLGVLLQRFFDQRAKANDLKIIQEQNRHAEELTRIENQRTEMQAKAMVAAAEQARMGVESTADAQVQAASYGMDQDDALSDGVMVAAGKTLETALQAQGRFAKGVAFLAVIWTGFITGLLGVVDVLRKATRPVLTLYLVVLVTAVWLRLMELMADRGDQLTATEVHGLVLLIVQTIVYLATVCVLWWFGTRPPKRDGDA